MLYILFREIDGYWKIKRTNNSWTEVNTLCATYGMTVSVFRYSLATQLQSQLQLQLRWQLIPIFADVSLLTDDKTYLPLLGITHNTYTACHQGTMWLYHLIDIPTILHGAMQSVNSCARHYYLLFTTITTGFSLYLAIYNLN